MKEIIINGIDEKVYFKKFDNDFSLILYPTEKSKNFYITLTTDFGAMVTKYKDKEKIKEVIPGTAHFLEHKVCNLNDLKIANELESLGTSVNAYTSYYGTTYNLYGNKDVLRNIEILFNRVYTFDLTDKSVENEKSIIAQEISMQKDLPGYIINNKLNKNLFSNTYIRNTVLGEVEDINKINKEYLYEVYDDFYTPNNMFCVVTGNFDKDSVCKKVEELLKNIKKPNKKIAPVSEHETPEINVNYEEIELNIMESKVWIAYKIPINNFKKSEVTKVINYLIIFLNILFSETSEFASHLKKDEIITGNISYNVVRCGEYLVMKIISSSCNNVGEFINRITSEVNNYKLDKNDFDRKRKVFLSSYILSYEDIENINDMLVLDYLKEKKVINDRYDRYKSYNFTELKSILKKVDLSKKSIVVAHK